MQSIIDQKCSKKLETKLEIEIYQSGNAHINFSTLPPNRDWMDKTFEKHAYRCLPVSLSNTLGWTFSFPEDISFIWDGNDSSEQGHVKVLSGERFVSTNRANATISFETGLWLRTKESVSVLLMPVPNQFIDGVQGFTTIINTSVLSPPIPYAWKITKANEVITIPAHTPIVSILPINLKSIQDTVFVLKTENFGNEFHTKLGDYGSRSAEITQSGSWTNFYRDAVNHLGEKTGSHELKSIKLSIKDERSI